MTTLKLHIEDLEGIDFIIQKQMNYSYAFRALYKQLDISSDKDFMKKFCDTFNFNEHEYRSLKIMVSAQFDAQKKIKENTKDEIEDLKDMLDDEKEDHTKRFKLFKKINKKEKSLDNAVIYGGRYLLRQITKECNKTIINEDKLNKLRIEYRKNRVSMPFVIVGESSQYGNRFFDLKTLNNGYCIYKPCRGQKYKITFTLDKKRKKAIKKLIPLIEANSIAVTVSLSTEYLYLTYDEQKLNGFNVNESERRLEIIEIKKNNYPEDITKQKIKDCYKKYYKDQEERQLKDKNQNRYIAIDMNPDNIGCSIIEKTSETDYKVLKTWYVDLSFYFIKHHWASGDKRQKHLNNKRKYELTIALKKIFRIAMHYKCAYFVMEDLNFKPNDQMSRESHRKIKNLWCRDLITKIINRKCNETGIQLVEVNACYSSFIGNIQHPYGDSCSASIEIGRRGAFKYTKGMFYPHVTQEDIDTLGLLYGRDALYSTMCEWTATFKSLKESYGKNQKDFQDRFRTGNVKANSCSFSMNSRKTHVRIIEYPL